MSESTPEKPALLCIPDITGFTRFIAENNMDFSRKIIPPLLRKMIDSNALSLKVGEIEGDAVVFYRFGELPSLEDLSLQCRTFYSGFNEQLRELTKQHADDFQKYLSSSRLSLKIIIHSAVMTSTEIEGHTKLLGEDVVVAHKLLKNSVEESEYILMTKKFLSYYPVDEAERVFSWEQLRDGADQYEFIGDVGYRYIALTGVEEDKPKVSNPGTS